MSEVDYLHTGPGTLAGRYMRSFWQPVYRAEDLAAGEAKPVRILGEDFTLYRGETGKPHAVGFRCAHRGTQLSTGWVEDDCLRCFFHGWKYDPTGLCVEMPAEKADPSRFRVPGYPTEEYLGLIFVYFGEGDPPPLPRYRQMEQEGVRDVTADRLPINFFFSLENDALHFAFTHRDILPERDRGTVPEVWAEESDWGLSTFAKWPERNAVGVSHKGMPNIGYIVPSAVVLAKKDHTHALHVSWRVPVDDECHAAFRVNLIPVTGEAAQKILESRSPSFYDRSQIGKLGDAVLAGEIRMSDIEDRTHIEFIQDYVAQVGQGSIATREHEHLGLSDSCVTVLRRIWTRELKALEEGRPLKPWRLTEEIEPAAAILEAE